MRPASASRNIKSLTVAHASGRLWGSPCYRTNRFLRGSRAAGTIGILFSRGEVSEWVSEWGRVERERERRSWSVTRPNV